MKQIQLFLIVNFGVIFTIESQVDNSYSGKTYFIPIQTPVQALHHRYANCYNGGYANPPHNICLVPPAYKANFHTVSGGNPLADALLLSTSLGLHPKLPSFNHYEHLPLNPYLALLLSHYGQYAPIYGKGRGLYGYTAANNYHNNKPFGAYKVYEDNDG